MSWDDLKWLACSFLALAVLQALKMWVDGDWAELRSKGASLSAEERDEPWERDREQPSEQRREGGTER